MAETQRQKQKNLTRKNIIETAIKLFSEKGFTKTTTSDVAKAAKVSHGTIFVHFKTQDELLTAVIEDFGTRINARLHELAEGKGSVHEVLEAHIQGLCEFEEFYTKLVIENSALPKSARNTFVIIQSTVSFHISKALEMDFEKGLIRRLPVELVFNGWVGMIHYYLANHELFSPEASVLKRYGPELVSYYSALINI